MARISYPEDWMGPESIPLTINFAELTKLAKANSLDSGHLGYLVEQINETVLRTVNQMIVDKETKLERSKDGDVI